MLFGSKNLWVIVQDGRPLDLESTKRKFSKDGNIACQPELLFEIYSDFDLAVGYIESWKTLPIDVESEEKPRSVSKLEIVPLSIFLSKMMEREYNNGYTCGRDDGYDGGYDDGRSDERDEVVYNDA